jgi:dihydropteroate synthase
MVNDVSGLRYDPRLASVAAETGAALVLTHTRGRPKTMYVEAVYSDVVAEVTAELRASIAERDWGTAAAVTAAILGGAHIVRVHAVEEMIQVVRVAEEIRKQTQP